MYVFYEQGFLNKLFLKVSSACFAKYQINLLPKELAYSSFNLLVFMQIKHKLFLSHYHIKLDENLYQRNSFLYSLLIILGQLVKNKKNKKKIRGTSSCREFKGIILDLEQKNTQMNFSTSLKFKTNSWVMQCIWNLHTVAFLYGNIFNLTFDHFLSFGRLFNNVTIMCQIYLLPLYQNLNNEL